MFLKLHSWHETAHVSVIKLYADPIFKYLNSLKILFDDPKDSCKDVRKPKLLLIVKIIIIITNK